ncbi:MAG TPA: DUF441 domain-containing protein [Clostridia bacterium]|nr:DUF441 domain-containing protein [Clostridia bacterium]
MTPEIVLLFALLAVGIFAHSNLIAIAAFILIVIKLVNFTFLFPLLETRGLEIGLLFLLLSIMVPLAAGKITGKEIIYNLSSLPGIIAIISGALATHLNSEGLKLMQLEPEIIFGMLIGAVIGIVFFGGMPVGPLMAAGVTALFLEVINLLR